MYKQARVHGRRGPVKEYVKWIRSEDDDGRKGINIESEYRERCIWCVLLYKYILNARGPVRYGAN